MNAKLSPPYPPSPMMALCVSRSCCSGMSTPRSFVRYIMPRNCTCCPPHAPCSLSRSVCSRSATISISKHIFEHLPVDILLDVRNSQHTTTPGRLDDFGDKLRMTNSLPAFHNPDNRGLTLKVSVFCYTLVSLLVFLLGLLKLDLIDADSVFRVRECAIDTKFVVDVNVFSLRMLGEWPQLCACK